MPSDELAYTSLQDPFDDEWTKTTFGELTMVTSEIACRCWINISSQGRVAWNRSPGLFEDLLSFQVS